MPENCRVMFESEQCGGSDSGKPVGVEIVQLNETHAGAVRPGNQIAALLNSMIKDVGQGALKFGQRHAAPELLFLTGCVRPCHVKMRGPGARKRIEHAPCLGVMYLRAVFGHAPPVFLFCFETTPPFGPVEGSAFAEPRYGCAPKARSA